MKRLLSLVFTAPHGHPCVGIIGATGSGKSTLITHMNGLNKPTSGKIFIDGRDLWAEPEKIRDFRFLTGLVFQYPEYQLFEETCYKDIAFGPKNMGLDEAEIDRRVHEAASFVGLDEALLEPVVKTVALSILTRLTAEVCRASGEGGLAAFVETAGTILALGAALPLARAVTSLLAEMLT